MGVHGDQGQDREQAREPGAESVPSESIAGVGRRIGATLVDGVLFAPVFLGMSVAFGTYTIGGGRVEFNLDGFPFWIFVLTYLFYCGLLEAWRGQTVGKIVFGIRVVRRNTGEVPGAGAVAVRALVRLVDASLFYLVAFIAALISPRNQRFGDQAARTLVVRR